MPSVRAQPGDTLCSIAIAHGFADCAPLRAEAGNAAIINHATHPGQVQPGDTVIVPEPSTGSTTGGSTARHRFRRRRVPAPTIRFVHGSPDLPYQDDPTLRELSVSNLITDRAGDNDGSTAWVDHTHRRFDADAHADQDTFKVEVLDLHGGNADKTVQIEALRPQYDPGSGALNGHTEFPGDIATAGTERNRRSLTATASRQGGSRCFRTGYLRLVVDDIDRAARADQTLLTTDMVAAGDRQVEILDQDVRASYTLDSCTATPASARCRVSTTLPIGRGQTVQLFVNVLRGAATGVTETTPGGPGDDGVVNLADIRQRIDTFCRRYWAQAHVRFTITHLATVDLPSDMLTVADATGNLAIGINAGATGIGRIGFTLRVNRFGAATNSTHVVAPIDVLPLNTPEQTAQRIKAAIDALPNLSATVSVNNPETGDVFGSADIQIQDAAGGRITITNVTPAAQQDSSQTVQAVSLTLNVRRRNSFADYHVGHPEQRNLVKALDSGDQVIDIAVVNTLVPGSRGFTVPEHADFNANRQTVSGVRNSIIMPVIAANASANNPFSLPHEIGHILTDNGLHSTTNSQLMRSGTSAASTAVGDSKRICERLPTANNWQTMVQNADGSLGNTTVRLNAVDRVNTTSGDLLS